MPLVRIDIRGGQTPSFGAHVDEIAYQTMVDTLRVPLHDRFQVIAEHDAASLLYDPISTSRAQIG
jgi:4-oxalocrotonate tautomerase